MDSLPRRSFLGLGLGFGLSASTSMIAAAAPPAGGAPAAADTKPEELLKIKKFEIVVQKSPDYNLKGGTTEKRFKPKDWLEFELEIDVKAPKAAKKDMKFLDDVVLKYFVFLQPADPKNKKVLTAEVTYINVPIDETIHSVVYLSHNTLFNITGDKTVNKTAVAHYGVEARWSGKLVGLFASSKLGNAPWWESPQLPPVETGRLLTKSKTPFAPLWSDYYMEEKADVR